MKECLEHFIMSAADATLAYEGGLKRHPYLDSLQIMMNINKECLELTDSTRRNAPELIK